MTEQQTPASRAAWRVLGLIAIIFIVVAFRYRPPAARGTPTPRMEFSAGRARQYLQQLVGDNLPHPLGSVQNAVVRSRIVAILTELGYQTEIQTQFTCGAWETCATVNNIVARLDGSEAGDAVLLAAHYDSVPAGPGASDDGTGVAAILELARLLKALPVQRHSIIFLIDDGEEAGLLGARAFTENHPWASEVRAAVNLDARGTSGPSLMYETGSANDWLMGVYARAVDFPHGQPITSSLAYSVYKQLPNDTDFTVFKAVGYQGFNFAFIGNVARYHTPLDSLQNADADSLQHQGDNALETVLALANSDIGHPAPSEAVFFDVLSLWTAHWPAPWSLPAVTFALALLLVETVLLVRKSHWTTGRGIVGGMLAWLLAMLICGVTSALLLTLLEVAKAFPSDWVAYPIAAETAFSAAAFLSISVAVRIYAARTGFWSMWAGTWIWWGITGVILAARTPQLSFVFVVPAILAALAAIPAIVQGIGKPWARQFAVFVPGVAAAILGFSAIYELYPAVGADSLPIITFGVGLVLTAFLPIFGETTEMPEATRSALFAVSAGIVLVAAIVAVILPPYSKIWPERASIQYVLDADSGKGQWQIQPDSQRLSPTLQHAATFSGPDKSFPWSFRQSFFADAPHLDLAAPTLTIEDVTPSGQSRIYKALLRSPRGAPDATVYFPPASGVKNATINGHPVPPPQGILVQFLNEWHAFDCPAMPPEGVEIQFTLPSATPVEVYVQDESYGLPPEADFLLKARPVTEVASEDGDISIVTRRLEVKPTVETGPVTASIPASGLAR